MKTGLRLINKIIEGFNIAALATMLGITFLQVLLRYLFNRPTIWSEELTLFLLVWFGFVVMAIGIRDDSHIALEYFYQKRSKNIRKILDIIHLSAIFILSVMMIYFSIQMIQLGWNNKMPATQIRRGYLYASSFAGGILFMLFSLLRLLKTRIKTSP